MVLELEAPAIQARRGRRRLPIIDTPRPRDNETSIELELPKEVTDPIRTKNAEILAGFEDPATRPDLVLVLERSAVLPASSLTRQVRELSPDTRIAHLPIGKVLPYMYGEVREQEELKKDPESDFEGELDLDLRNPDHSEGFISWIRESEDPTIRKLAKQIEELELAGKRIQVIDDARSSGETTDHTLPLVLESVYGEKVPLDTMTYFSSNFSWEKAVVRNLGMDLTPAETEVLITFLKGTFDIRRFKMEMDSEFYDIPKEERREMEQLIAENYNEGNSLIPVDSVLALRMTAYQAAKSTRPYGKKAETDPAGSLLNKCSFEELIRIRDEVQKKFSEI